MKTDTQNTIGSLAYFDSFSGLVPCKVIEISDKLKNDSKFAGKTSDCIISVKLTANCRAYKRGETIQSDALKIIPRKHISRRKYGARIIGGYSWKS
jgi:hypothetical protein